MKQVKTRAIILSRTDYSEADRILTLLSPDLGKLRVIARGVRREKSKLAGGIELFSISNITLIRGKSDLYTITSTRLIHHYAKIVQNLDRTMLAYDLVKQLDRATEDEPGREYFNLLEGVFATLEDKQVSADLIRLWFGVRLLQLGGYAPNTKSDANGKDLTASGHYDFDYEVMAFRPDPNGRYIANHIKWLRLAFSNQSPAVLARIKDSDTLIQDATPLIQTMLKAYIRL